MRLGGQVALVTGGSRGIGRAIALGLAREGADVAVNFVARADAAERTAEEIRALGRRALAVRADTADRRQVEAMVAEVGARLGPVDVLVNNAGVQRRVPFLDLEEGDWDWMLSVDLKGYFLVGQAVARTMRPRGRGSIVNVSSEAASLPAPRMTAYCVAKAGVAMLTRCMALELAPWGIRVNALAPGLTLTDLNRADLQDEAFLKARLARIPLGRVLAPEDLVAAAVFLASPDSAMMTGATVQVDGGRSVA
ncbi:MAG TPA: 3-oxoacyl-ACP reductase family protein [Candidatus Binatia bacterium]|jgi:NAD(P)-dependent dehydrogenase (short-subunit alcohol dehydrogenase family)|nr:3-oxoacyl-ACP reductase family protein [Candidatus Binatia bacterium]